MDENKKQFNIDRDSDIKNIRTYTSDMAEAIRENETSVIKIALAEKDRREREEMYKKASGTKASKILLLLGGIVLIIGAIVGSYLLYKKNKVINAPQVIKVENKDIISYDDKVFVDVMGDTNQSDLFSSIKNDIVTPGKPGSIKAIFLTQKVGGIDQTLSIDNFMSLMNTEAPAPLLRTLDKSYMIGTYTDTDQSTYNTPLKTHLFLILTIKDYNQAYASMLEWEKTMLNDLFILFNIDISGNRSNLLDKQWKDIIVNNKNARILYDTYGNDVLYYMFTNTNNIIITDSQSTINEINSRLLNNNTKPL
ncbi:MAG: hypothetical protein KGI58_00130 [Patescibacteria group bacterium]|nr:hypothetical protein [Patescibacteria group bacterium]